MSAKSSLPMYLIDAFAERPFTGNSAAVCLLDAWPSDSWLQSVAAEMKHSETAFLVRDGDGFHLRWFTPGVEVALCGHATLASAHVLLSTGAVDSNRSIPFTTLSGVLAAKSCGEEIELDFPATPAEDAAPPPGLLEALGVQAAYVGRNRFDYLVEVASESQVRALQPDFRSLAAVECRGVIVTAPADSDRFDFVSRFFAPAAGIDEDPVTGSAHCALGPFWQQRLGKAELRAFQASARGGAVGVVVDGSRVRLRGRAITIMKAELLVAAD